MPTLDDFRKQAKDWLKKVRRQNPGSVKRLRLAYPKAPGTPGLRDIQHALAREHGYVSWHALKAALERQDRQEVRPLPETRSVDRHVDRVALFLQLACWNDKVHGRGDYASRQSAAVRLLGTHPEITSDSLYTAGRTCVQKEGIGVPRGGSHVLYRKSRFS